MSRAGFVTSRILFGNTWKFGRLTEGTIQGRKKKITGKFLLSRLNKKIKIIILTNWKHYEPGWVRYQQDFVR